LLTQAGRKAGRRGLKEKNQRMLATMGKSERIEGVSGELGGKPKRPDKEVLFNYS